MDEMTLLRGLRADIRATDVTREAEEALISRITAEAANPRPARLPGPAWAAFRRLPTALRGNLRGWRLAVAAAVSLALVAGLTAGVAFGPGRPRPAPAVLLAERAAAGAAKQQPVPPGQWVYTKTVEETTGPLTWSSYASVCRVRTAQGQVRDYLLTGIGHLASRPAPVKQGASCTAHRTGITSGKYDKWAYYHLVNGGPELQRGPGKPFITGNGTISTIKVPGVNPRQAKEQWGTADGTRNAAYEDGKLVVRSACPCGLVSYADLGKLPSDPHALVRWAMRPPGGGGHYTTADLAWNAFNGIEGTLMSYVLPPTVAAELYRALGDIPGVTVDTNAVDAAGRHGPAFVLTDKDYPGGGWTAEIFLNPRTFQLVGYAEHFPLKCGCPSPGTGGTAILRHALVSGPGIRP